MEKKLIILVALCVICIAGNALAVVPDVYQWFGAQLPDGTGRTTEWTDGGAWLSEATGTHGLVPTSADRVKINSVWANAGPVISSAVAIGEIMISETPGNTSVQSLTVAAGGNLVTGGGAYLGQINIGYFADDTGALIMDGGTATVTQHLWLGWAGKGILQMNSGTLNTNAMFAPGWNGGNAEIHLDGGLLHSAQWWGGVDMAHLDTHNYSFDIRGDAIWEIHGMYVDEVQYLIDNGWITSGAGPATVAWDAARQLTVVTPEPVTLSLLGLGALLLRRRS